MNYVYPTEKKKMDRSTKATLERKNRADALARVRAIRDQRYKNVIERYEIIDYYTGNRKFDKTFATHMDALRYWQQSSKEHGLGDLIIIRKIV